MINYSHFLLQSQNNAFWTGKIRETSVSELGTKRSNKIMKPLTVILAVEVTVPEGFFTVTEYSPASAVEQESILSVHWPFAHVAVTPFAFVSTGFLSFCQTASTGSAAALIAAVSSSGFPVSTVASFSGVEKTGAGTAAALK